ncbi:hypothetical protein TNCV_1414011 [Trichonephila clavipes]|nr:hypothetical protein TNCV_1414011 [Trichonephila clavipes]
MGIDGNEKADFLARTVVEEEVSLIGSLTFSELFSLKKIELHHLGRTPFSHLWYFGRNPGGSFKLVPRKYQTAFSRFAQPCEKYDQQKIALAIASLGIAATLLWAVGKKCDSSENYELNTRLVYAMPCIGNKRNLEHSMAEAVREAVDENDEKRDLAVAVDGSWQKRGFLRRMAW